MPELPEVETIRRGLQKKVVGKKIADVKVCKKKIVRDSYKKFKEVLVGSEFSRILRRGKLLTLEVGEKGYLLIHLKMTGQLIYRDGKKLVAGGHNFPEISDLPNKYSHVIFTFKDKSQLFFNDMRQFGYLQLVDEAGKQKIWDNFGVEPIDKTWNCQVLRDILHRRETSIKAMLLKQEKIAGLGNIYVDEALWLAKIRPDRIAGSLSEAEIKKLAKASKDVLLKAIEVGGTTFSDYRKIEGTYGKYTKYLRVYDREGEKCKKCKQLIKKMRVAGRGTHYCPECQV